MTTEYFEEKELQRRLVESIPCNIRDVTGIICEYGALFLQIKLDKDCAGEEVKQVFPTITCKSWDSISILDGLLTIKSDGQEIGQEFCEVFGGATVFGTPKLVYTMSVCCNNAMFNRGLGCYFIPADSQELSAQCPAMNRLCYHPGFTGTAFRIEGTGRTANQYFGWTAQATEDGSKLQTLTMLISSDGKHSLRIAEHTNTCNEVVRWENKELVTTLPTGGIVFPKYGMYPSDLRGATGAKVFYSNFSVRVGTPEDEM